jgi:hypothetical protein
LFGFLPFTLFSKHFWKGFSISNTRKKLKNLFFLKHLWGRVGEKAENQAKLGEKTSVMENRLVCLDKCAKKTTVNSTSGVTDSLMGPYFSIVLTPCKTCRSLGAEWCMSLMTPSLRSSAMASRRRPEISKWFLCLITYLKLKFKGCKNALLNSYTLNFF